MISNSTHLDVLKLKEMLLDSARKITEEKKGLLSLEESKTLSVEIFTGLMSFNRVFIKAKGEDQTKVLNEIKKTSKIDAYIGYTLLHIDEGSVEDKFNPNSLYDWEKRFYFLPQLLVSTIELNDPYTRSKIRSTNTAYARKSIRNFDEIKETLGGLGQSDLYLVLLKYGILTKPSISQLLCHCKKQLAAFVAELKEPPSKNKKPEKKRLDKEIKDIAVQGPESRVLSSAIQSLEREMDKVRNWTSYPELTCVLEILLHCFVLYNDEVITDRAQESLDPSIQTPREYFFENRELMQSLRDCFYEVWSDPLMDEITKDTAVAMLIDKVYMSILSVEGDLTYKSCAIMRQYPSLLDFHANSQLHPEAEEVARNLERLTIQLLQGAFLQADETKRGLGASQIAEHSQVLLTKEFLERMKNTFQALDSMMTGTADTRRQWPFEEVLGFKYSLVIYNVPHLILDALHALTVAFHDRETQEVMKAGLNTLGLLIKDNVLASAQIFKEKEWTLFIRLYQFIPRHCIVLLMVVAAECCALFSQQPYIMVMIIELLSVHLCKLEQKLCQGFKNPQQANPFETLLGPQLQMNLAERDKELKKNETDETRSGVNSSEFILIFGSYELLYRILISCKKYEVKFKMSLSVQLMCLKLASQVVIPFLANAVSIQGMESYSPILINEEDPDHCKAVLLKESFSQHKLVHLQWEAYFSILKTLNETCTICQSQQFNYYFEPYFKKFRECLILEILSNFNQFTKGIIFSTEIIKFYTTNFLMDFSPNKEMHLTEELEKEEIVSRVLVRVNEIHDIIESINSLKGERFNSDNTEMNQSFILEGLLPAVYKLLNSIQVESFRRYLVEFEIGRIFSCLTDNRTVIMRMIGKEDQIKHLKGGMFKKKQFKKSYDQVDLGGDALGSADEEQSLASLTDDLEEFLHFIEDIYEMFPSRPCQMYRLYSRERQAGLKSNPKQVFDSMNLTGSISAKKFRDRVLTYSQTNEVLATRKGKALIKRHKSLFQHMPFMMSTHQAMVETLADKSSYIRRSLEYYMDKKVRCITDPDSEKGKSSIYSVLDDGSDSDNDAYYNRILLWIIAFSNKVSNPGHLDKAVSAKEGEEGIDLRELMAPIPGEETEGEDNGAINIVFVREQVVTFSPEFMTHINNHRHAKDDLLISQTTFFQWLVILDNLLMLRSSRIKKLLFDNYCAPSNGADCLDDLSPEDYVNKHQGEVRSQEEARKIRSVMNRMLGRDFLQLLLESATLFQQTFKSVLFSPYLEQNFRYFYTLCSLIQKLADDNNQEFKQFVGGLSIAGNDIVTRLFKEKYKSIADCNEKNKKNRKEEHEQMKASELLLYNFYNGLNLKTHDIEAPLVADFTFDEQTDMIWYNIVAINAVAEYFNGPCPKNQNLPINNIDKLFKVLYKINSNINSAHYHLQMAIVRLLSSLFEGGHQGNLERASKAIQPVDLYNLIIKYIKTVYVNRGEFLKNRKNPELPAEPMPDANSPEEIMVFYEAYPDFAMHPSIKIANSLLFIFRALGSSLGESNRFHKFFKEKVEVLYCVFSDSSCLPISQTELRDIDHRLSQGTLKPPARTADLNYYHFIHMISEEIEIALNEETRISIPFPILPKCRFLSQATKASFLKTCNINDTNSKLIDLSTKYKYFEIEMAQNMNLYQRSRALWTLTQESVFTWVKGLDWGLALLINFLCIWNYRVDALTKRFDLDDHNPAAILGLNVFSLVLEVFFLAIWFAFKFNESYQKAAFLHRNHFAGRHLRRLQAVLTVAVLRDPIAASLLLSTLFSCLSLWNPFFYSLQLFKIVYLNDTVRYVMRSIWMHFDQLLFTLILVMFTTLSYSVLIGSYFKKDFDSDKTFGVDLCPDPLSCFGYILDLGLRYGGGVGNIMKAYDIFDPTKLFYGKLVLELSFFIFINAVSLNIIFGIIVDTFKELRKDMQNRGKR